MIQTLIKLGSQLSHNRGEWDDIIDYPNIQNNTIPTLTVLLKLEMGICHRYLK